MLRDLTPAFRLQPYRGRVEAKFARAVRQQFAVGPEVDRRVVRVLEDDVCLDAVIFLEDAEESVFLVPSRFAHHTVVVPAHNCMAADVGADCRAIAFRPLEAAEVGQPLVDDAQNQSVAVRHELRLQVSADVGAAIDNDIVAFDVGAAA